MEKRSLFSKIFKTDKSKIMGTDIQLMNGYRSIFTSFNGDLYRTSQIRTCIDVIARNGAKLSPKHIRSTTKEFKNLDGRIQRLISEQPNEIDNAYSFYYKVISQLYLNNNAFVFIQREGSEVTGLYPLMADSYRLVEYKGDIYVSFSFRNGRVYTASMKDDIIHLKRFYCEDDVLGGDNLAIVKLMSLKHIIDEGIVNAIKTSLSIRGILKTTKAMLKPSDIKKVREQFVEDFIKSNDGSSIASVDATTDFIPISMNPITANESQVKNIDEEIKNYFGICDEIIQSKYDENKWSAFYESVLEPIAIQLGQEMTNKLFTIFERFHGNKIVFEANKLQYASNETKIKLARYMNNYLTINEIREVFNLAPVENGDIFAIDVNHNLSDMEVSEDE